jgi:glutathione S-transferase
VALAYAGPSTSFPRLCAGKIDYAIDRYTNEARRLYGVIDKKLASSEYLAGDEYTIADIAVFAWARSFVNQGIDWADFLTQNAGLMSSAPALRFREACRFSPIYANH